MAASSLVLMSLWNHPQDSSAEIGRFDKYCIWMRNKTTMNHKYCYTLFSFLPFFFEYINAPMPKAI